MVLLLSSRTVDDGATAGAAEAGAPKRGGSAGPGGSDKGVLVPQPAHAARHKVNNSGRIKRGYMENFNPNTGASARHCFWGTGKELQHG